MTLGAKLTFVVFRQHRATVQGVLRATDEDGGVSESMVRWVEKLPRESVVLAEGKVRKAQQAIKATDFHDIEMDVLKVRLHDSSTTKLDHFILQHIVVPTVGGSEPSTMDCR